MTSSNRILRADDLGDSFVSWHAPEVEDALVEQPADTDRPVLDPAILREQAWQQGFEQGRAEGMAAGKSDLLQHADVLERVLSNLARPLQLLDSQLEDEVLMLIKVIARQLVRREIRLDPSHIISIIREGLASLPAASVDIQVRLHPQDAAIVRELLSPAETDRSWSIEADPLMEQGGCQIVSATAQIDGRLDTRLGRVVATMLDDERAVRD